MIYPKVLLELIEYFKKFPGIGDKSAERMALALLDINSDDVNSFANAMLEAKNKLHPCNICGCLTDNDVCMICSNEFRRDNLICILEDFKTIIFTDRELFNKRSKEITSTKKSYYKEKPEYIENINDIKVGEYVVHTIHGLGIYKGLSKQEIDGQLKDYLTIEYANKDRLHIPAEQINLLCRYRGSGSVKPKLSKMGGRDWENTKAKVKKAVEVVAYDLLRLYARRKMQEGIQFLRLSLLWYRIFWPV